MTSRRFSTICIAAAAFALGYVLADRLPIPNLFYYPVERRWSFERTPGVAMAYYGHALTATAAAVVAGLLACLRSLPRWVPVTILAVSYAVAIVLIASAA